MAVPVTEALTSEHAALATYQGIVSTLGSISPFDNAASAEEQHISALETLARNHGIPLPAEPFHALGTASTKTAACSLGVRIEESIVAMYGTLLPEVTAYSDATRVFTSLQSAARDNLLPAFEHCA